VDLTRAVALAAAFLALGALGAAARTAAWTAEPLGGWVDERAVAVVRGAVTGEPTLRVARSGPARWLELRLLTDDVAARGGHLALRVPIVVRLAADTRAPPPGTRIEVTGRLGPAYGAVASAAALTVGGSGWTLVDEPGPLDRLLQAMRSGLRAALAAQPPDAGALVAGLAVGDDSTQPPALTEAMRASGLAHLTAVSGGNVAIVLGAVLLVAVALRLPLVIRVVAALVALGGFVLLVGPEPSVLRASVMGAVVVAALLVGGRRGGPSVLATGVLILVVVEPSLALSWAFALSAGATAGLILLAPRILARSAHWPATRRWPVALRQATAITLAAQLATLPILVAMGGAAGWVAVPANLAAMPAVPPVTILGLLAAVLAPALPGLAALAAQIAAWPAGWIAMVAHAAAGLPAPGLPLPSGWPGLVVLAGLAATLAGLRAGWRRLPATMLPRARVVAAVVSVTAVVVGTALPPDRRGWPPAGWIAVMCDVGQGDALLLRAAERSAVVVDAGPDPDLVDGCLADAGIDTVPALVLTHFHADHVRGVAGVLRSRAVAQVLVSPVREPAEEADAVDAVLAAAGLRAQPVTAGDHRVAGELDLRLLWPRRRIATGSVPNNGSLVAVATVRGRRLLLTGDIEPPAQSALAADLRTLTLDVVKIPHHGSKYQSPLLPVWAPAAVALVSVGAGNDYGHPADETLAAWAGLGAIIGRTDQDGDVAVVVTEDDLGVVRRDG
jgi:competence protein ComEC